MRQYQGTRIHIWVIIRGLGYIYASVSEDQDTDMRQYQRIRIHICVSIRGQDTYMRQFQRIMILICVSIRWLEYIHASLSETRIQTCDMRHYHGTRIHTCVIIRGLGYLHASLSVDLDTYIHTFKWRWGQSHFLPTTPARFWLLLINPRGLDPPPGKKSTAPLVYAPVLGYIFA